MIFAQEDFNIDSVLNKPLMAHLSTVENGAPRDSPVWFIWEDSSLWIFGTHNDSFIRRLQAEPRCAVGVVDFNLEQGILKHVGLRGAAHIYPVDPDRVDRFVSKYLGNDRNKWNAWFVTHIVAPLTVMVHIIPETVVAKDVSYFKAGLVS